MISFIKYCPNFDIKINQLNISTTFTLIMHKLKYNSTILFLKFMTTNRSRETFCHTYLHNISMAATCGSQSGGALYKQYMKKNNISPFSGPKDIQGNVLGERYKAFQLVPGISLGLKKLVPKTNFSSQSAIWELVIFLLI